MTIKVHFDMYHGFGNLDKAIELLDINDREILETMLIRGSFNPFNMFFCKSTIYSTITIVFYLIGLKNVKVSLDLMKQKIMVK